MQRRGTARGVQCLSGGSEGIDPGKEQLRSMLNEHCVRLEKGFRLCHPNAIRRLLALCEWTPARTMLLQQLHGSLVATRARRTLLRRYMAQEIVAEEALLRLTRLCGINLITLYGVVAAVGDVRRFSHSKKLVAYFGLNPVCRRAVTSKEAEPSNGTEEERCARCSSNQARNSWK